MRRLLTLVLALFLVAAACGDDDAGVITSASSSTAVSSTTTAAPPTTTSTTAAPSTTVSAGFAVTSDDGRVTLDVPSGALDADPGITITRMAAGEVPEDLTALDVGVWAYAMEPDGLEFDQPVQITVEIPLDEASAGEFPYATPLFTLVSTSRDGTGWEALDGQLVYRDAASVVVAGFTDHFSRLGAIHEQVYVESRFVEISRDAVASFGIDFLWSNGTVLTPPVTGGTAFVPQNGDLSPIEGTFADGLLGLPCPAGVSSLPGAGYLDLVLPAVDGTTGETGAVAAPRLTGVEPTLRTTVALGVQLVCRPTIALDGTVEMTISVDHPGGDVVIPNEDFAGGLSGMLIELARAFPGLFVGLIRDLDGDGQIGPEDLMYPPVAATVDGGTTSAVLPLYGYGDYFPYFLTSAPREFETEVTLRDGATIVLGGLSPEDTAVPMLGDIPLLGRVFGEESAQSEDVELVILLTPHIVQGDEE